MDLQLRGKHALVTGSSSGIGEAIAKALAAEGVAVAVNGRKQNEARRVAEAINDAGGKAIVALGDLSTDEGASQVAAAAIASFGAVDIVVNNAAAFFTGGWDDVDPARWQDLYNLNVVSMVRVIRHFLPQMKGRGWGRLIQIASAGAALPSAMTGAYGATKSAIVNLSVGLAKALSGSGITVNTVSPGATLTPALGAWIKDLAKEKGWRGTPEEIERRFVAEIRPNPTGRIGRPEEVADLVAFIASPRAGYINGADLRVDGGLVPTVN